MVSKLRMENFGSSTITATTVLRRNMKTISKNTLAISCNSMVRSYDPVFNNPHMLNDPAYRFSEGVWNEPVKAYGDRVLLKGDLANTEEMEEFVGKVGETIHQAIIYAGSLSEPRQKWLMATVDAIRKNNPTCKILIFVCPCAQGKIETVQRIMALTGIAKEQWFEQSCVGREPHFEGQASDLGNHPIWYTLMISRYYGQDLVMPIKNLNSIRTNPAQDRVANARILGQWLMGV